MFNLSNIIRVLLATIQNLCLQCDIQKVHVSGLETTVHRQRWDHKQTDTLLQIARIDAAHKVISEKGAGVRSTEVENILKERSEVPTHVSEMY